MSLQSEARKGSLTNLRSIYKPTVSGWTDQIDARLMWSVFWYTYQSTLRKTTITRFDTTNYFEALNSCRKPDGRKIVAQSLVGNVSGLGEPESVKSPRG